ncbi:DMT family transporter [bacterium]|nr:DMT family transporter [bacterium]
MSPFLRALPLFAALAYAWAAIFIRWSEPAGPLAIAFYRMLVATTFWAPFYLMKRRRRDRIPPTRRQWVYMILAGIFLCLHFATWTSSLMYTSVASAVFLILTQPVMVAVAAHFILKERLTGLHWIALALAVIGAGIIFGGDISISRDYIFGDILALIGAFFAGAYLFMARLTRPDHEDGTPGVQLACYLVPVYGLSAVGLLIVTLAFGEPLGPFPKESWLAMLGLGLVPTVIGHSLFNFSLKHLSALPVNIALVIEPVGASLLAIVFFQEAPSQGLLIGSPILIVSVVMIFLRPPITRKAVVPPESGIPGA